MAGKKKLFQMHDEQRRFLDRLPYGIGSLVIRQCIDIGAQFAKQGLLTDDGLDMERIERVIRRGSL